MSLYKHSTEPKVKVQTAQGEGKGPLLLLSHLSTCLRTGTHWVEKLGSCGSTVGVGRGRKEGRRRAPGPAGGGGEELRALWNGVTPASLAFHSFTLSHWLTCSYRANVRALPPEVLSEGKGGTAKDKALCQVTSE